MRGVVLVTGGCGFIGSHVVDKLSAAGYEPRILDLRPSPWHDGVDTVIGDVRRVEDVRRALRGCDAVCHLAAAADVADVQSHPAWATELNSMGTLNVLEAAREAGVKRVLYASTVWVYSDVHAEVVDEDTPLRQPAHLYTAGKLSGELYCRSYAELYGLETTVVRFGIPYGPRARPGAVIPSFLDRALRGQPLVIAGSGAQERSFVYVEDLAEGVVAALGSPAAIGCTYNMAGRETTTIRDLAELVRQEVGDTTVVHADARAGDLRGARIDSGRAERELGWRAMTPLRDGIRRYAAWLRAQDRASEDAFAASPLALMEPPARRGGIVAIVAAGVRNPAAAGAASLLAVASACATVVAGAGEERRAEDFSVLGLALLMPLWALTTVEWAPDRRLLQSVVTVVLAAAAVLVLVVLSSAVGPSGIPLRSLAIAIALSAALTGGLRLVPRHAEAWDS